MFTEGKGTLLESNLPGVKLLGRGKVRDLYEVEGGLLVVTTDRISAFDVVMSAGIPDKGAVLTALSLFWFKELTGPQLPSQVISANVDDYPEPLRAFRDQLEGRSMLVKKTQPLPVECVVRGYLAGSGWAEYRQAGTICGIKLPGGLTESQQLPMPLFTPSTKAEQGSHDRNISYGECEDLLGDNNAYAVRELSLALYRAGAEYAWERGIIIADTKFEFGLIADDRLILIDEVLTPDSSRFWPRDDYEPGRPQKSFDKQYLRDWLDASGWNRQPPPPQLPEEVIRNTREKYLEALRRLGASRAGQ
ncbi:MAG: phosphoribosylaminoimidazolesuccinocarboxamide synthase [Pseudomonadota bacterium]